MPSIMQDIKSLHPLLIFFIFEPPYLALTYWGLDKMAAILQMMFTNSWMKTVVVLIHT